jgi:hypothetical protein
MVAKFSLENKTASIMNVIVEPEAVNFDLEAGKAIDVELSYEPDQFNEKLDIVLENGRLIIYQNRGVLKVYIDNELRY